MFWTDTDGLADLGKTKVKPKARKAVNPAARVAAGISLGGAGWGGAISLSDPLPSGTVVRVTCQGRAVWSGSGDKFRGNLAGVFRVVGIDTSAAGLVAGGPVIATVALTRSMTLSEVKTEVQNAAKTIFALFGSVTARVLSKTETGQSAARARQAAAARAAEQEARAADDAANKRRSDQVLDAGADAIGGVLGGIGNAATTYGYIGPYIVPMAIIGVVILGVALFKT